MPDIIPSNSFNYQSLLEQEFTTFLIAQHISSVTQKNYRMDLRKFFHWIASSAYSKSIIIQDSHSDLSPITPEVITAYIQTLKDTAIPLATINRQLSSLRIFFQCAELHGWCNTSPLLGITNLSEKKTPSIQEAFDTYLQQEHTAEKTRKNYCSDVQKFIFWFITAYQHALYTDQGIDPQIFLPQVTIDAVKQYKTTLLTTHTPISTINRTLSAMRKLFQYAQKEQWVTKNPIETIHNLKEDEIGFLEKALNDALFSYTDTHPLSQEETEYIKHFFYWMKASS